MFLQQYEARKAAKLANPDFANACENQVFKCELCDLTVNSQAQLDKHTSGKQTLST